MLKKMIRDFLISREDKKYEKDVLEKKPSYHSWYTAHKRELQKQFQSTDHSAGEKLTAETVRFSHLKNYILSGTDKPDIIIACDDEGNLTDYAEMLIRDFFAAHSDISMLYGDEDRINDKGELKDPWFKSDWAPDTFLSTFYFGSIFAFRSSELLLINPAARTASDYEARSAIEADSEEETEARRNDLDDAMSSWIYDMCLKMAQAEGGFSVRHNGRYPIGHIPEVLFHRNNRPKMWNSRLIKNSLTGRFSRESAATRLISIIIPSKDNPEVLGRCLATIQEYTDNAPYEIIVVDNGSSDLNQSKVRLLLEGMNDNAATQYIYGKADFNFSRMCNCGAAAANGDLLLFLNDDIEIRKPGWLSYLSEKAKLPYVGAVGMKLLYPNSDVIQHAGVVNLRVGPVHKLQYLSNTEEHYFGYNKGVRNVMAVTGACLMLRTELFREAGGFDEERFAVAFNDVDLCYRVYKKGYYNVVRNNMYLYHHESLSRGDDRKDEVKSLRLSAELETLLRAHSDLYGVDPFYHRYLTQNPVESRFAIDAEEMLIRDMENNLARPEALMKPLPEKWTDPVLRVGVEYANSLDEWYLGPFAKGQRKGYYIKGYSFVIHADNAVYERFILLRTEQAPGRVYAVPTQAMYRDDIAANLTGEIHDQLTGFFAVFEEGILPPGEYQVGMLAKDRTSRQRLVNWSDVILKVTK
jgi:GT2 family glycosyltransferase